MEGKTTLKIDVLVAEIGSTTTVVSAFTDMDSPNPRFLGQGMAETSVLAGDVTKGLENAIHDLESKLGFLIETNAIYATSSAAGGLKMSVHGLIYDMTVKAAKEAALGAGGNILWITAGPLNEDDLQKLKSIPLNMILIAGGVDYGESQTALENAMKIANLQLHIPVVYAGNIVNQAAVKRMFESTKQAEYLFITSNVYPRLDTLAVEEVRHIIQDAFEKNITEAKGMEKIRSIVKHRILPTPAAVLEATIFASQFFNDLLCVDIGGATTDVHSVTQLDVFPDETHFGLEPLAKRSVEGDLGIYINKNHCVDLIGKEKLAKECQLTLNQLDSLLANYPAIPSMETMPLARRFTQECFKLALTRHAGRQIITYGPKGKIVIADGKDLRNVKTILGTGGALTRLPH